MPPFAGAAEWLGSEPLGPAELRGHVVAGELLDADVHQLATPGAVRPRVVAGLPRRRARRHRGPHAGVLLRARDRPHPAGDQGARDRLPGRGRQPLRRSGARSTTTTGRRSTSSTRRASSATSTSAKDATSNPSASSSGCSACSANSSPSKGVGVEAAADWDHLQTPETYLGYGRSERFAPADDATLEPHAYQLPKRLQVNHWALAGDWTIGRENVVLDQAGGSIAFRFHARDAHLVLSAGARAPIPFRVLLDGEAPGPSAGVDVDEDGTGVLRDGRLYQLIRQHDTVHEQTLEITFLERGAEAYAFTFG